MRWSAVFAALAALPSDGRIAVAARSTRYIPPAVDPAQGTPIPRITASATGDRRSPRHRDRVDRDPATVRWMFP